MISMFLTIKVKKLRRKGKEVINRRLLEEIRRKSLYIINNILTINEIFIVFKRSSRKINNFYEEFMIREIFIEKY